MNIVQVEDKTELNLILKSDSHAHQLGVFSPSHCAIMTMGATAVSCLLSSRGYTKTFV